ncbi:hypothetical protein BJ741DRAFT_611202 [Chytriomyces cf. hyalinus JEL632]|nr:hypothetical protein BJ741DRAFT_611202 [Chytriomyces cf. hyalinus JEL632]
MFGLFLEGARWNVESNSIVESMPRLLFDVVPVIWLKPTEVSKLSIEKKYECPIHKIRARRGPYLIRWSNAPLCGHSTTLS